MSGTVDIAAGVLLLPLGAPILEPDLHLGLGERQRQGQVQTLADAQVARLLELVLQRHELLVGEGCARSARLRRRVLTIVVLVLVLVFIIVLVLLVVFVASARSPVRPDLFIVNHVLLVMLMLMLMLMAIAEIDVASPLATLDVDIVLQITRHIAGVFHVVFFFFFGVVMGFAFDQEVRRLR